MAANLSSQPPECHLDRPLVIPTSFLSSRPQRRDLTGLASDTHEIPGQARNDKAPTDRVRHELHTLRQAQDGSLE